MGISSQDLAIRTAPTCTALNLTPSRLGSCGYWTGLSFCHDNSSTAEGLKLVLKPDCCTSSRSAPLECGGRWSRRVVNIRSMFSRNLDDLHGACGGADLMIYIPTRASFRPELFDRSGNRDRCYQRHSRATCISLSRYAVSGDKHCVLPIALETIQRDSGLLWKFWKSHVYGSNFRLGE